VSYALKEFYPSDYLFSCGLPFWLPYLLRFTLLIASYPSVYPSDYLSMIVLNIISI
jgi:hypothetical protein